jgi:hypothetical protein
MTKERGAGSDCIRKPDERVQSENPELSAWTAPNPQTAGLDAFELRFRADTPRMNCRVSFHFGGEKIGQVSDDVRDAKSAFVHEARLRFKLFPAIGSDAIGAHDLLGRGDQLASNPISFRPWQFQTLRIELQH